MEKTAGGLDENVAAALTYLLGWITGVGFLLVEPSNRMVRFHARQSTIVFGGLSIAWFVAMTIPFIGWFFAWLVIPYLSKDLIDRALIGREHEHRYRGAGPASARGRSGS